MKITMIENGQTQYCIAVPIRMAAVEETGAQELQSYLKKALGVELPIVAEEAVVQKAFYLGHTEYAKTAGICGNAKENWIMQMHDGNLVLTGGVHAGDRGTLYAVYHFLEDVVGVRWWSTAEEDVPVLTELKLDAGFYREGTPTARSL